MPLFRRRQAGAEALRTSIGVDGHELVVGGSVLGCRLLDELDGYVGVIARRMPSSPDGRDSIAVQNAKMDYVEMADAAVLVVTLALEDLADRGIISATDVPVKPHLPAPGRDVPTYEYIQATYSRAERRITWVREVDAFFRERGIGLAKPEYPA